MLKYKFTNICGKIIKIGMNGLCLQYHELWKYSKEEKKVNALCIVDENRQIFQIAVVHLGILKVFS